MSAAAYAVLHAKSKSFSLAARLLPRASRDDVAVLYAYCRRADDAVDEAPAAERAARVRALCAELGSVYAGEAQREPLLAAVQELVRRSGIPEELPRALLEGMRSDVGRVRVDSWDELLLYAHRVAGVVGVMLCHVWGVTDAQALRRADELGIALQLTNIARDVAEDWQRDRVYLPGELLRAHGAEPPAHAAHAWAPPPSAVEQLLAVADEYYARADQGLRALPFRVALAVRTARLVYAAIGHELRRLGYDVHAGRAVVPGWKKLWLAVRALGAECWARRAGFGARRPLLARSGDV